MGISQICLRAGLCFHGGDYLHFKKRLISLIYFVLLVLSTVDEKSLFFSGNIMVFQTCDGRGIEMFGNHWLRPISNTTRVNSVYLLAKYIANRWTNFNEILL